MRTGQEKPKHFRTEFTRVFVFSVLGVFRSFSSFFVEFSPIFGSSFDIRPPPQNDFRSDVEIFAYLW